MATVPLATEAPPDFRSLTLQVKAAGLLDRRRGYYLAKILLTLGAFAAVWAVFFLVGASWLTLIIAMVLGIISTQLGFLGHDAGHRQIFSSQRANRLCGLLLGNVLIGLSYGWWVPKHHAHHSHPNRIDHDPDIGLGPVRAPTADAGDGPGSGLAAWMARWQAELFLPLMLLRSTGVYVSGAQDLLRRRDRPAAGEGALLLAHVALYLTAVFWVLSPLKALAFLAVNQAVLSVYLGCSFAPNHKGMKIIECDADMCFAQRQVVTSRNISGNHITSFVFGGLNYQIEHHLFPAMPRPNLPRAQELVRSFCVENGYGYCEESPLGSYRQIMRGLRAVSDG
jgi:fatty acid desaturase